MMISRNVFGAKFGHDSGCRMVTGGRKSWIGNNQRGDRAFVIHYLHERKAAFTVQKRLANILGSQSGCFENSSGQIGFRWLNSEENITSTFGILRPSSRGTRSRCPKERKVRYGKRI